MIYGEDGVVMLRHKRLKIVDNVFSNLKRRDVFVYSGSPGMVKGAGIGYSR
jgi:hypothetical protein